MMVMNYSALKSIGLMFDKKEKEKRGRGQSFSRRMQLLNVEGILELETQYFVTPNSIIDSNMDHEQI